MAKYYGKIGFVLDQKETEPGIYENVVEERPYYGDVIRNARNFNQADKINGNITIDNSLSILADGYATGNIVAMRYAEWMGQRFVISHVEVEYPRLILTLGGVYNGPTPAQTATSDEVAKSDRGEE